MLPEFDNKSWKAVLISNTTVLDVNLVVGIVATGGYMALMVEDWDSTLADG